MNAMTLPISTTFSQLIDGELQESPSSYEVIDPAVGKAFARAPLATREQLDAAVAAARRAQPGWASLSEEQRGAALSRFAAGINTASEELAVIQTREQGKPLAESRGEVLGAAALIDIAKAVKVPKEILADLPGERRELRYRPLGVIGAITPWNGPVILAVSKICEALLGGNTMVLKPSPYTPLATLKMGEIAARTLPPGVLNILSGDDRLGVWMTEHRSIDMISFTGSSATGKKVAVAAATSNLKRLLLELGGNDPAIVLEDVDVEAVAPKLFAAAFANCGQVCMAIKRLYVHESVYEKLCDALARQAEATKVGNGFEPGVVLGPLQNKMQYDRVIELIEDARAQGANFRTGGVALERPGYFIAPTIVTGISEGVRLVDEEQFGPVLPIIPFRDIEDVIARANATRYGLSGSVWTRNSARGQEIAARLEVGTAWVNKHLAPSLDAPFGGAKESGLGRAMHALGAKSYMEPQVLDVAV